MEEKQEDGAAKETYRVTDRRRGSREESPGSTETSESGGTTQSQASADEPAEEAHVVSVTDLLRLFMAELHARAWVHMGLVVDPTTTQLAKDLPQAQLAIDCLASLIGHLAPFAEHGEREHLEGMLADLRINYVRQSGP